MRTAVVLVLALLMAGGTAAHAAPKPWKTLPKPPALPDVADASGTVAVGADAAIYWVSYGDGSATAPPVILLHGGLGSGEQFGFQVAALVGAKRRAIVIDTRGHGRSTLGTAALSYHQMAEDVVAVMDALSLKQAVIAGWSDGGSTALDLAVHHADRVAGLFVLDANANASGTKPRGSSPTFAAYEKRTRADYARLAASPDGWAALVKAMRPVWKSSAVTDAELATITAPTVICAGAHDEIIRQDHLAALAKRIPGATLVIIPDASHFALWQTPDAVNAALLELAAAVTTR